MFQLICIFLRIFCTVAFLTLQAGVQFNVSPKGAARESHFVPSESLSSFVLTQLTLSGPTWRSRLPTALRARHWSLQALCRGYYFLLYRKSCRNLIWHWIGRIQPSSYVCKRWRWMSRMHGVACPHELPRKPRKCYSGMDGPLSLSCFSVWDNLIFRSLEGQVMIKSIQILW